MSVSTATAPSTAPSPADELVGPKKRWTTAEFDRLVNEGFIREGSSTYLWDFEIIEPMPENQPHRNAVANLYRLLIKLLPEEDWTVDFNGPLEVRDGYKPQPDLVVLYGPRERYNESVPVPSDVALVVEVSNTSYPKDSVLFLREYASAGIPQYWIINIPARRVEVYRQPSGPGVEAPGYARRDEYALDGAVPLTLEGVAGVLEFGAVPVAAILRNSLATGETGTLRGN